MKRFLIFLAILAMLAIAAAPAAAQEFDNLFDSTMTLKPNKACTTGIKNFSSDIKTTFQVAAKGHTGDTVRILFNQMPNNFGGSLTQGYSVLKAGAESTLTISEIVLPDTNWYYSEIYPWDSLRVANNTKFIVRNLCVHDTIHKIQVGAAHRRGYSPSYSISGGGGGHFLPEGGLH
jgi:hypothetical protein